MAAAIGSIPHSKIRAYLKEELDLAAGDECDRACAILRRADNAYVSMVNSGIDSGSSSKDEPTEVVKMTDVGGVKNMMRRFGERYKASKASKASRTR